MVTLKYWHMEQKPLKQIIAQNLTDLRKKKGVTQIQLAELFNYSDKAVSKWECGDTTPDVETLKALADYYGVTLDYFIHEGTSEEKKGMVIAPERTINKPVIALLSCMIPALIATVAYFTILSALSISYWMAFCWWIPIDALLLFIFSCLWWNRGTRSFTGILLIWTFLICLYVQLGVSLPDMSGWNLWAIFFIGIPLTIACLLWVWVKKKSTIKRIERHQS